MSLARVVPLGRGRNRLRLSGSRLMGVRTGGVGPGYDVSLLVLAAGQRTIAIGVATRAGTSATRWRAMVAITELCSPTPQAEPPPPNSRP